MDRIFTLPPNGDFSFSGIDAECGIVEDPVINAKIWILKTFYHYASIDNMGPHSINPRTQEGLIAAVEYEWEPHYGNGRQHIFDDFKEEHEIRLKIRKKRGRK